MREHNIKKKPIVPAKYMGQWIAWDREQTHIVASGDSFAETLEAAEAAGEPKPILAKVPRGKSMGAAGCSVLTPC